MSIETIRLRTVLVFINGYYYHCLWPWPWAIGSKQGLDYYHWLSLPSLFVYILSLYQSSTISIHILKSLPLQKHNFALFKP